MKNSLLKIAIASAIISLSSVTTVSNAGAITGGTSLDQASDDKLDNNPNAKGMCGCGESFQV